MKTEKWTFSPQKGKAGHCFQAQVWDEYGGSVAVIESADIEEEATEIAKLISKAPRMAEALKWFITSMSDGSLNVFTDDSEHKAVHDDNQDHINEIEALVKELK